MIEQVKQIVREASEIIKRAGDIAENTMAKEGTANYVTKYDLEVQKFLMKRLSETFEGCHFIGEEAGCDENPVARGLTFIIDPIDGTTNYFRRRRCSMISIGAVENKLPVFGGLYDPYLDEMYLAERGKGATCNGERIRVSDTSLDKALIGFGSAPYYEELFSLTGRTVSTLLPKIADVRRTGSACRELCDVARGISDGHFEWRLQPWDYCAGTLLIEEAGGRCGDIRGGSVVYDRPMAHMAANARIFDNLREVLQSADCENPDSMV